LQSLLDSQIGTQTGISSAITGALGNLPTGAFDPSGINTDDVRQRSYDSQMALLRPEFDRGFTQLQGMLSDRGLPIGSEIANDQFDQFNTARDRSLLSAARTADQDAMAEHQRQYGNKLTEYNMPFQNLSQLMGNSQAVGNPQFSGVPQSQAANTDTASNVWNAYNANLQNAQNQQSQLWSGVGALGNLFMLSDETTKEDIKPVGELYDGQQVYSYRYKDDPTPQIGLMAQEVEEVAPEAVADFGGVKGVRYDLATKLAAALAGH
jgi:hypothetical protein